jgi:hypothetical protein
MNIYELDEVLGRLSTANKPIRYDEIKTVRVKGRRAVRLPDGKMLAKQLNRKLGTWNWVVLKEVA